jgi:hypothetical protein
MSWRLTSRRQSNLAESFESTSFFCDYYTKAPIALSSCMNSSLRLPLRATRFSSIRSSTRFPRKYTLQSSQSRPYIVVHPFPDYEMPKDKEKMNFQLKVPKGTKDWEGRDMVIRDKIFGSIIEVFKRHGAVTIDTLVNLANLSLPRMELTF